jgi:peptide subunit release factor 1 (eRF1)
MSDQDAPHDHDLEVDQEIVSAVDRIRNRYGATGLRQLIALAEEELQDTENAMRELTETG